MDSPVVNLARTTFIERFGAPPTFVVRAPGRVNLIGEHTDYNDGFVLPMAIDRWTVIALRPRAGREVVLHSLSMNETGSFSLDDLEGRTVEGWLSYARGVAGAMAEARFELQGWEGVITSDVPVGAGLSSSASFELAMARAFTALSGAAWDAPRMARIGQRAENHWAGVNCGIMDQLASACGKDNNALLVDCRSLDTRFAPLSDAIKIVVLDTAKTRGLADSAYNERRSQCNAVAAQFGVPALRDITVAQLEARKGELDPLAYRRARHVVTEDERTLKAYEVMTAGDLAALGKLMNQSHASLRDDFEVSCAELDAMVECAQAEPGCLGARMTGAGFGGCAVALVESGAAGRFTENVTGAYKARTGLTPMAHICRAVEGAEILEGAK